MFDELFISNNVPSSKNSKQWTGKFLISSKYTRSYLNNTIYIYRTLGAKFRQMVKNTPLPLYVGFYFVRDSKRHFDYINACQVIADTMVEENWIADDDADNFIPVFLGYHVDKTNCGVFLSGGTLEHVLKGISYHKKLQKPF